jgi:uncharacterized protein (TIGR03083 family)
MGEPIVDVLEEQWSALVALGEGLTEEQWKTPTALPGWTVQDCLSHVIGIERMLMGDPAPEVTVDHLSHLTDPMGASLETWVEARRGQTGAEVLDEFREQMARRLTVLRAMSDDEMSAVGWSPVGEVPHRDFMKVRVFDCWMHEQDMRRALGLPGHLVGPAVDLSLERFRAALGYVVGKKAGAPDGASVVFALTGAPVDELVVVVVERRARVVDEAPDDPTVRIRAPFESFIALGGGRWDAARALAAGDITFEGDAALGQQVLENMGFTP